MQFASDLSLTKDEVRLLASIVRWWDGWLGDHQVTEQEDMRIDAIRQKLADVVATDDYIRSITPSGMLCGHCGHDLVMHCHSKHDRCVQCLNDDALVVCTDFDH